MSITEREEPGTMTSDVDPDGAIRTLIEQGHTLPSAWYTSEKIFDLEQRLVFRRSWECVGHRGQVRNPGDSFSCEVGGVPIVVARGGDSIVRAFHDDGATRPWEHADEDKSGPHRTSASVDFLGDMVFVNPAADARDLHDVLGPIPELARRKGLPIDTAVFRQVRSVDFNANWKIGYDNNCECYHCATIHSSWYKQARLDKDHVYSYPIGPIHFEVVMDQHENVIPDNSFYCWPAICITSSGGAGKVEGLDDVQPTAGAAHGHAGYFCWRFVSVSPRTSRIELSVYSVDELSEKQLDAWFETILSVVHEDRDVCERVQNSHNSGAGRPGTLIATIDSEFHTLTWERLLHRALTHPESDHYAPILEPSATWPLATPRRD